MPESFCSGLLKPIIKKPTLDPTQPSNYMPITISIIFSKLLDIILDCISEHQFDRSQYGFVPGRGMDMVTALTQDIIEVCRQNGPMMVSLILSCSILL